jgi:hypothetical protein
MNIRIERFSWLFIGIGIGFTIGKEEMWEVILGVGFLLSGFIMDLVNEKKEKME